MKIMAFANALIGGAHSTNMPVAVYEAWQESRVAALASALDEACSSDCDSVLIAGGLFGEGFIIQHLLDEVLEVLDSHEIPVVYAPYEGELASVENRMTLPETVRVIEDLSALNDLGISIEHSWNTGRLLCQTSRGMREVEMAPLEPLGFGSLAASCRYLIMSERGMVTSLELDQTAIHPFISKEIEFDEPADTKEMSQTILAAITDLDDAACVHISLCGRISLNVPYDVENLERALQDRFFFVEIADESEVAEKHDLSHDEVSLLGEFLRIVESDTSLSKTERSRVIRCGCRVLSGHGVN